MLIIKYKLDLDEMRKVAAVYTNVYPAVEVARKYIFYRYEFIVLLVSILSGMFLLEEPSIWVGVFCFTVFNIHPLLHLFTFKKVYAKTAAELIYNPVTQKELGLNLNRELRVNEDSLTLKTEFIDMTFVADFFDRAFVHRGSVVICSHYGSSIVVTSNAFVDNPTLTAESLCSEVNQLILKT